MNHFFRNNLRDDGCFKEAAALREEFGRILGGRQATKVVHQCGSGRHGVPEPAGDGSRRALRLAALSRLMERMVRGSRTSGGDRPGLSTALPVNLAQV